MSLYIQANTSNFYTKQIFNGSTDNGLTPIVSYDTIIIQNQFKNILGTTAIEGNTLTEEQITAIIEGKPVVFKTLSTATASRDLKHGVDSGQLTRHGDKRNASYAFKKQERH
jgi:Fic family protein